MPGRYMGGRGQRGRETTPPLKNLWGGEIDYSAKFLRFLRRNEEQDCYELSLDTPAAVAEMIRKGDLETYSISIDKDYLSDAVSEELKKGTPLKVVEINRLTITFQIRGRNDLKASVPTSKIHEIKAKATLVVKNGRDTNRYRTIVKYSPKES